MNLSRRHGQQAEDRVATELSKSGYQIVERNWRCARGEIDIIASKDDRIYFVEVRYRQDSRTGDGLVSITKSKWRSMERAAEEWLHQAVTDAEVELLVVAVSEDGLTFRLASDPPSL